MAPTTPKLAGKSVPENLGGRFGESRYADISQKTLAGLYSVRSA
jgi:hypothetical protein